MGAPVTRESEYLGHVSSAEARGMTAMSRDAYFENKKANAHVSIGLPYYSGISSPTKKKKSSWKN